MKKMNLRRKLIVVTMVGLLVLTGCSTNTNEDTDASENGNPTVVNTDAAIERATEDLENSSKSGFFDYSLSYDEEKNVATVVLKSNSDSKLLAWGDTEYEQVLKSAYSVVSKSLKDTGIGVYAAAYKSSGDFIHGWNGQDLD